MNLAAKNLFTIDLIILDIKDEIDDMYLNRKNHFIMIMS